MKQYTLGVDIGGTKCAVVLGQGDFPGATDALDGFILDKISFETKTHKGPGYAVENICTAIGLLLERSGVEPGEVLGIGVSCGGPLDHRRGVILNPPNLYGWDNVPIVELLSGRFGMPAYLENDANACALAEWRFGAARGCHNVIFLTFGTGMGAGLILGDRLYNGSSNMAGEVGHVRLAEFGPAGFGKAGSFEGFCSGGGIAQIARAKVMEQLQMGVHPSFCPNFSSLDTLTAKSVAEAAEAGDELAKEIYALCGHYLGLGMAILVDILNPDIIVLGSIYERSEALLWPSAGQTLAREALAQSLRCCRVVPASLGNEIGDYAALSVALDGNGGTERRLTYARSANPRAVG